MKNKQEIQSTIDELKAKIKELESQLNFSMMGGDWYVTMLGDVVHCQTDDKCRDFGVERPTKQQAEDLRDWLKPLLIIRNFADQFNGNWVADWGDDSQEKWCICFDHNKKKWRRDYNATSEWLERVYMPEHVALDLCQRLNSGEIKL